MDLLTKGVTTNGFLRIYVLSCRETVETARKAHKLSPLASATLGRTLAAGQIMGGMLKNENSVLTIQFKGDGEGGRVLVTANSKGEVKGYIENPAVDLPLNRQGKLDVGGAIGKNGSLSVVRDIGMKEPYIGQVPIQTGEIGDDMAFYFAQSEQIPSAVGLGVLVDTDLSIKRAGGFIVQVMPGCDELSLKRLENSVGKIKSVTQLFDGRSNTEIAKEIMSGFELEILEEMTVCYKCGCSRDRMENALISLGSDELNSIIEEQGEAELSCQFCDRKYKFSKDELIKMLKKVKNEDINRK